MKKPWQSKTLLINGILGVIAFVAMFVPQASSIGDFIGAHGAEIGVVWSVLNVALRFATKDKITLTE